MNMATKFQERTFETGIVTINYAEFSPPDPPSGPPLLMLHGGSGHWQYDQGIYPTLTARYHLYAPDFRGHGKSGRVPGRYRLQDYTDDTIAFLRRCVAEPAYLFGHSMGGMVALMVAAQAPDVVRAMVVGDAPLTPAGITVSGRTRPRLKAWRDLAGGRFSIAEIAEALRDAPTFLPGQDEPVTMRERYGEESGVYEELATRLYHNDPDMLTALIDDHENTVAGYDMEALLPAIRCPVLLLQADPRAGAGMDSVDAERALSLLAQGQHVQLEGIGHILFSPHKEPALRAIIDFFASA
jgi:pimeloyl-ACP methyl ester carboxylesterase